MTTIDTDTRVKRSGRHPINVGHFVMGIAFLGIVLIWILIEADAVTGDDIRWLLPVPWVLAGVAGLLATTRRKHPEVEAYDASSRGWVGREEEPAPVEERASTVTTRRTTTWTRSSPGPNARRRPRPSPPRRWHRPSRPTPLTLLTLPTPPTRLIRPTPQIPPTPPIPPTPQTPPTRRTNDR